MYGKGRHHQCTPRSDQQIRHGYLSAPNDCAVAESTASRVRRDTSARSISTWRREYLRRIRKREAQCSSECIVRTLIFEFDSQRWEYR